MVVVDVYWGAAGIKKARLREEQRFFKSMLQEAISKSESVAQT